MWIDDLADEDEPVAALVDEGIVPLAQAEAALSYRVDHGDEVNARIAMHRAQTAAADQT